MLDYRDKDFIFTKEDCNYFKRKIATILKEDFVFSDEERKEINSQYSDLIKK